MTTQFNLTASTYASGTKTAIVWIFISVVLLKHICSMDFLLDVPATSLAEQLRGLHVFFTVPSVLLYLHHHNRTEHNIWNHCRHFLRAERFKGNVLW